MIRTRRIWLFFPILALFALAGIALSQGDVDGQAFTLVQQIGRQAPTGIEYDANFDRVVMVDVDGQLVLADAATFETQRVLYESGAYSAYEFSHSGRMLAVEYAAPDNSQRVHLWDTNTGEQLLEFESSSALGYSAPLQFSDDDTLLHFTMVVRAPDDIRRSENDTSNVPYIWDIGTELDLRDPILPERVIAQPFFDLRNGFILGPNNTIIAARVDLIEVIAITNDYDVVQSINTPRYERDPIDVWYSWRGDQIYFRPQNQSGLFQINTRDNSVFNIPISAEVSRATIETLDQLVLSGQARIIGEPTSLRSNSFTRLLLGDDYRSYYNDHALTVILLDILRPITLGSDQFAFLVYTFDEQTGRGVIELLRPSDVSQIALHPDNRRLMVRRASGVQPIEIYDLETGDLELSVVPALGGDSNTMLQFNSVGDTILAGFQRFDVRTGETLYEDLSLHPGFERFFFADNSQSLVTVNGADWWQWDIETGGVIRRERINLRGSVEQVSPDARRYLTYGEDQNGRFYEVWDVGTGDWRSVSIQSLPGAGVSQIFPSPDWENYLVTYNVNEYGPYAPGNQIALYNLDAGLRWFIAGDDLPDPASRSYGWSDNRTAYVAATFSGENSQPRRIYGLEYDPSGLPACLVEAFPNDWTRWIDLWEVVNARLRVDALGEFTQQLCAAVPAPDTAPLGDAVASIDGLFHPTPQPTRPYYTPTPAFVAGLPSCITSAYPDDALQYAEQWRQLTAGLSPEAVAQMAFLLCEGLQEGPGVLARQDVPFRSSSQQQVMTIDIETGERSLGGFLPTVPPPARNIQPVLDEFRRTFGYDPQDAVLSDDGQLLAIRTPDNFVQIYRLGRSYAAIMADIEATTAAIRADQPDQIAIAPTATQPFESLGQARPTLTPTVTPTAPPMASMIIDQPNYGEETELCDDQTLYTLDVPPPGYAASGRLLVNMIDYSGVRFAGDGVWEFSPATGEYRPNENLIDAQRGTLSFDENWLLWDDNGDLIVSRPDGSDPFVLFEAEERSAGPSNIYWLNSNTVEYSYEGYLPEQFPGAVTLLRRYHAPTRELSEPFQPRDPIVVNDLNTEVMSEQPGEGTLAVVRTPFNTGFNIGYKYYIYNRTTETADYFYRTTNDTAPEFYWHPLGRALYYWPPSNTNFDWYVYDAETHQHRVLGDLPRGTWSRDARYLVYWQMPSQEEVEARIEAERPIPKLEIWDSETGLTRHYCIPQTRDWSLDTALYWSPDMRYLVFQLTLPDDQDEEVQRPRTLVLDTETGTVTQLSIDISRIITWTE